MMSVITVEKLNKRVINSLISKWFLPRQRRVGFGNTWQIKSTSGVLKTLWGQGNLISFIFIFAEASSADRVKCGTEVAEFRSVEGLPKNQNLRVFLDNSFFTLSLLFQLRSMGILATATLRSNKIVACQLMAEKDLKNEDYGVFHYRIEENTCTHLLKSFDNKSTTLERRRKKFKCNVLIWWHNIMHQWLL